jgi:hypothetical protein
MPCAVQFATPTPVRLLLRCHQSVSTVFIFLLRNFGPPGLLRPFSCSTPRLSAYGLTDSRNSCLASYQLSGWRPPGGPDPRHSCPHFGQRHQEQCSSQPMQRVGFLQLLDDAVVRYGLANKLGACAHWRECYGEDRRGSTVHRPVHRTVSRQVVLPFYFLTKGMV